MRGADTAQNPSFISNGGSNPKEDYSPKVLKRDEWSDGAVSSLLEAYEAKWVLRNRAKLKGQDWEDVARHVSARGNSTRSPKTLTQCKNKIESMKKRYRSESAAADGSSWPLYSRLDLLLRGKNNAPSQSQSTLPPPSQPPLLPPPPPPPTPTTRAAIAPFMMPPLPLPPRPSPPPPSLVVPPQNSHSSDGYGRGGAGAKEDAMPQDGLSDNMASPDKNIAADTDSSTPALYRNGEEEEAKDAAAAENKLMRPSAERMRRNKRRRRRREDSSKWEVAESIRLLTEVVARAEEARTEAMRDVERMRAEAEVKRAEMELKRTEIVANTQLEIAKLFATCLANNNNNSNGVDPSLRIGRS